MDAQSVASGFSLLKVMIVLSISPINSPSSSIAILTSSAVSECIMISSPANSQVPCVGSSPDIAISQVSLSPNSNVASRPISAGLIVIPSISIVVIYQRPDTSSLVRSSANTPVAIIAAIIPVTAKTPIFFVMCTHLLSNDEIYFLFSAAREISFIWQQVLPFYK